MRQFGTICWNYIPNKLLMKAIIYLQITALLLSNVSHESNCINQSEESNVNPLSLDEIQECNGPRLSILYTTSCHKGHINPNAGIARALTDRGHKVDILTTGLCEDVVWSYVPEARDVIALDLHPQKSLDPADVLDMIAAARDLYIERHTIQAFNATLDQLRKVKYDILVGNFVVPGGIIAGKVWGIPVVASTVGPIFLLFKDEAENWDFEVQMNVPHEETMPEFLGTTIRALLSMTSVLIFSPMFSFIQEQHENHGLLKLPDDENDGSLPFSYYYRHTIIINQGIPQLNIKNFSRFNDTDNIHYNGFVPDNLLYPGIKDGSLVQFMDTSEKPVVFISLGTVVDLGLKAQVNLLKDLENQTDYRFVWAVLEKYATLLKKEQTSWNNLFVGSYLPQGQILQHDNTKVFLTHCGANSVQDAIFAAKPMLTFPGFGDQVVISKRIVKMNLGLRLKTLQREEIEESLEYMLTPENYAAMVERIEKTRDFMTSLGGYDTAADVIEATASGDITVLATAGKNLGNYNRIMVVFMFTFCFLFICVAALACLVCRKMWRKLSSQKLKVA